MRLQELVCCDGVFDIERRSRAGNFFRLFVFTDAFGTGALTFRFVFAGNQTSPSTQAVFQEPT